MALLDRALQRRPGAPRGKTVEDSRMTATEHLEALRRALAISFLAWLLGTVLAFFFWSPVLHFLVVRGGVTHLYFQAPTGAFVLALKIALYLGFVIAAPVIMQQAWWFVSPGLHPHERRYVLPLLLATIFFFVVGIAFALFSLPLFLHILTGFAPGNLQYLPFVDDYLRFVLVLILGFGLVFELPVVVFVLGLVGVLSSRRLRDKRFYWVAGLLIIAYLATPGADPITPLFMFVPLYLFWEGTVLLLKLTGR
jgi:sec-independent protein translocase protein TatC